MKYIDIDLSQNCYFSHLKYKLVHKKSEIVEMHMLNSRIGMSIFHLSYSMGHLC